MIRFTDAERADRYDEAATLLHARAAAATPGPWMAVLHDRDGLVEPDADLLALRLDEDERFDDEDSGRLVSLVMASALPVAGGDDGDEPRLSGAHDVQHVLVEHELWGAPDSDREVAANLLWVSTVGPAIAAPIVAMLRDAAERLRGGHDGCTATPFLDPIAITVLDIAR